MCENIQTLIDGMMKNPKTFIGKHVTCEEVSLILHAVGGFIRHHLLQSNNVSFPGIGIFALSQQKLPVSHHPVKYIVNQKPVFQLSHSLASRYQLKWARIHYEVALPEKELNHSSIAVKCHIARSKVILTLCELITFVEQRLYAKENLRLPVPEVGVLHVTGDKYRMEFDKPFLQDITMHDVVHVVKQA